MQKKQSRGTNKSQRGGDTSRTSSQGRKLASGGNTADKRGNEEIDENTKSPKATRKGER
jgi:hypothetical protein